MIHLCLRGPNSRAETQGVAHIIEIAQIVLSEARTGSPESLSGKSGRKV
jgi:hypothetical protein